jgi:hypothetical protein
MCRVPTPGTSRCRTVLATPGPTRPPARPGARRGCEQRTGRRAPGLQLGRPESHRAQSRPGEIPGTAYSSHDLAVFLETPVADPKAVLDDRSGEVARRSRPSVLRRRLMSESCPAWT